MAPNPVIVEWAAFLADATTIIGIVSISFIYLAHTLSKKQFKHSVMSSCIERFQEQWPDMQNPGPKDIQRYLDLTNEEMFYVQKDYLPEDVADEWMDGMISFLPFYDSESGEQLNAGDNQARIKMKLKELMIDFLRIAKATELTGNENDINWPVVYSRDISHIEERIRERKKLVKIIRNHLKKYKG